MTSPERTALENALARDPDDLAAHSAYADYLMEQGDPRGEFVQVQLALENPSLAPPERKELREREDELLTAHARAWLGDAGRFLVGDWSGPGKPYHFRFVRGWLDSVLTLPVPDALVAALGRSPEARLLQRLEVVYDMDYHPFDFGKFTAGPLAALANGERANATFDAAEILPSLIESPYLTNLRVFRIGFSDTGARIGHSTMVQPFENLDAAQIIALLAKCPRMEELYLNADVPQVENLFAEPALGNLRVLQYYFGTEYGRPRSESNRPVYPLSVLANNASLRNVEALLFHPGRDATIHADQLDALLRSKNLPNLTRLQIRMTDYGDEGARRIVASGVLKKLKWLDIGYGNMTDEGAELLAACADFPRLQVLDVSRNTLTNRGIAALKRTGTVRVLADDQHDADEWDYLYEVDFE